MTPSNGSFFDQVAKPILFSGPMVRAILDGRKTQTRRVVKPQPVVLTNDETCEPWLNCGDPRAPHCPYGAPGDRLWVREAFCTCYDGQEAYEVIYAANNKRRGFSTASAATDDQLDWLERSMTTHGERGRPGIHMPRWACRLVLDITGVRVERVQDISREDELAEGVEDGQFFDSLWDSINAKRAPWSMNPWVWVVTFSVATR